MWYIYTMGYLLNHQFSSVAQLYLTLHTPGFPVHHQLPELVQTHVHQVGDAIQPPHPLLPPSSPAFNFSLHQGLFQWVSSRKQISTSSSEVDGPRACHVDWSESENQILYINVHIWTLKRIVLMNLCAEKEWRHRSREQTCGYTGEGEGGTTWKSTIDIYTLPRVKELAGSRCTAQEAQPGALWWPREVRWEEWGRLQRDGVYIHTHIYIIMTDLSCCRAEINNYPPIKKIEKKLQKTWTITWEEHIQIATKQ